MSDNTERPAPEATPPDTPSQAGPQRKPDTPQSKPAAGSGHQSPGQLDDPTEALKRALEKTRLPPEVKEQILRDLPPPEEHERLYRELREKGGLSAEEFFASLGLEVKPKP
jgi:hypothetical protein